MEKFKRLHNAHSGTMRNATALTSETKGEQNGVWDGEQNRISLTFCRSSFNISPVRPCWQAYISEVHPSASRWLSAGFAVRFVGSFSFGSARVSVVGGFSPPVLGRWYETLAIGGSANVTAVLGDGSGEPGDGDGGSTVTTSTSSRAWSLNLTVCLAVDFFFTFTGEPARRVRGSLRGSIYRPCYRRRAGTFHFLPHGCCLTHAGNGTRTAVHRFDAHRCRPYPFRMLMRNGNWVGKEMAAWEEIIT